VSAECYLPDLLTIDPIPAPSERRLLLAVTGVNHTRRGSLE
jgi:hypothetical protein